MLAVSQGLTSSGTAAYASEKRYPAGSRSQISSGRTVNGAIHPIAFAKSAVSDFESTIDTRLHQDSFQLKESDKATV